MSSKIRNPLVTLVTDLSNLYVTVVSFSIGASIRWNLFLARKSLMYVRRLFQGIMNLVDLGVRVKARHGEPGNFAVLVLGCIEADFWNRYSLNSVWRNLPKFAKG